jgi:hypothetical protein
MAKRERLIKKKIVKYAEKRRLNNRMEDKASKVPPRPEIDNWRKSEAALDA